MQVCIETVGVSDFASHVPDPEGNSHVRPARVLEAAIGKELSRCDSPLPREVLLLVGPEDVGVPRWAFDDAAAVEGRDLCTGWLVRDVFEGDPYPATERDDCNIATASSERLGADGVELLRGAPRSS